MKLTFVLSGIIVGSFVNFLLMDSVFSQSSTERAFEKGYQARRDSLIQFYVDAKHVWHDEVAAKLATGRNVDTALAHFGQLMKRPGGDMFWMYPFIAAYLYGQDRLPDSLKRQAREVWRTYTPYRGDTENHWVMYYTSLYLAAQTWPGEDGSQWYNGKSSEENLGESAGWINHWMKTTTTIGQGEFDSPSYGVVYLVPMFLLYEFSKDPVMRDKAGMMIDYLLADFAADYLKGSYCGGHSRDYPDAVVKPRTSAMTGFGWLFFGDAPFVVRGEALFAALSSYKLPEIIYRIATDRSKPYVHTETKRVRNKMRHDTRRNPPVHKYTYMTQDYSLGSLEGGILQPIQQHTWDVTWVSNKPHNTLFTIHPYYSGYELGSFFPEEEKLMVESVVGSKGTYDKEDKWTGSSPYEATFQHKNAIIVLYNIEPGTHFEHIDGFFPKDLDERIIDRSGWIFCRDGDVFIAYYPLKPYEWSEDSISFRLRSHELRNGCIVEVSSSHEVGSFDEFNARIRNTKVDDKNFEADLTVGYITTGGDRMEFTFGGKRLLNGRPMDFNSYKLFNGPNLYAEVGSQTLRMTYKDWSRVLDFKNVRVKTNVTTDWSTGP
jgi:hypothetical protein